MKKRSKKISIAVATAMILSSINISFAQNEIQNHYAKSQIENFIQKGYLTGDKNGNYEIDKELTRAEFVTLINKIMGYNKQGDKIKKYKDINQGNWAYKQMMTGVEIGYINGTTKEKLSPNKKITRQEVIVILNNIIRAKNENFDLKKVKDNKKISKWARQAVQNMIQNGYIAGDKQNIMPQQNMTKAQAIVLLNAYKEDERVISFEGTYKLGTVNKVTVKVDNVTIKDSTIKQLIIGKEVKEQVKLENTKLINKVENKSETATLLQDGKEIQTKKQEKEQEKQQEKQQEGQELYKDGEYIGQAKGYKDQIKVKVTVKNGKIAKVEVLRQNEDEEFWNKAKTVIEKIEKENKIKVDVAAGATLSSKGIMYAVQDALKDAKIEKKQEEKGKYTDGEYIGEANGFSGVVKVKVKIENGNIKKIELISHSDDASYMESAENLLKDIQEKQNTDIDIISGATYSSNGLINAVKDALEQALGKTKRSGQSEYALKNQGGGSVGGGGNAQTKKKINYTKLKDGIYEGVASGYRKDSIKVRVTVKDSKIAEIEILENKDDRDYLTKEGIEKIVKQIKEKQSTNVDTISGATNSSNGLINAVANALRNAIGENAKEADKYLGGSEGIVIEQGSEITKEKIKNSFSNLSQDVEVEILEEIDTNKIGETKVRVRLTFSDKSTKEFDVKVLINKKTKNAKIKFLSEKEILALDNKTYKDGIYYGDSFGYYRNKPIPVKVEINGGKIKKITLEQSEIDKLWESLKTNFVDDNAYSGMVDVMAKYIEKNQNPQATAYRLGIIREVENTVMKEVRNTAKNKKDYINALDKVIGKHEFGRNKRTLDERRLNDFDDEVKKHIKDLTKVFLTQDLDNSNDLYKMVGTVQLDGVSGATYTAMGTSLAVANALKKADESVPMYNIIVEDGYKTKYNEGELLDFNAMGLKVKFFNKDNTTTTIPYANFAQNGLKVLDVYTNREFANNTKLDEKTLGHGIGRGVNLKIVHDNTNTFKFLNTVVIKPRDILCKASKIQVKAKNSDEWIDTQGFDDTVDKNGAINFIQKLTITKEQSDKLKGKELEFRVISTRTDTNAEKIFTTKGRDTLIWPNITSSGHSVDIPIDEFTDTDGKKLKLDDGATRNFRIYLSDGSDTIAKNYNKEPKEITVTQADTITEDKIRSAFEELPNNTSIKYDEDKAKELLKTVGDNKDLQVELVFEDKSTKSYIIKLNVKKDSDKLADNYNENPLTITTSVNAPITEDDVKRALPNLPNNTNIEITKQPDTKNIGQVQCEVTLRFSDGSIKNMTIKVEVKNLSGGDAGEFEKIVNNHPIKVVVKPNDADIKGIGGNTLWEDKLRKTSEVGELKVNLIKRTYELAGFNKISRVSIVDNYFNDKKRATIGRTKVKVDISFKDGTKLKTEIPVDVEPYRIVRFARIVNKLSKKEYAMGDVIDFSELSIMASVSNSVDSDYNWTTGGFPIRGIKYSQFPLFGIQIQKQDGSVVDVSKTVKDILNGDDTLDLYVRRDGGVISTEEEDKSLKIDGLNVSKSLKIDGLNVSKMSDKFKKESPLPSDFTIETILKPSDSKYDDLSLYESKTFDKNTLEKAIKKIINDKYGKDDEFGDISVEITQTPDLTEIGENTAKIKINFVEDNSTSDEIDVKVKVEPLPIVKTGIYEAIGMKGQYEENENIDISKLQKVNIDISTVYNDEYNIDDPQTITVDYGELKKLGIKVVKENTDTEVTDETLVSELMDSDKNIKIELYCEKALDTQKQRVKIPNLKVK